MKCPIDGKILSCPQDLNHEPMNCSTPQHTLHLSTLYEWEKKAWKYVSKQKVDPRSRYCIGYSWPNREDEWYEGLQLTRYECKLPCNGETPCIR